MAVQPAPAVLRAGQLLDALSNEPGSSATLAELSRATGLNKASAHSVLLALTQVGFAVRLEDPVRYALGPWLAELGDLVGPGVDIRDRVRPVLASLSEATGCTTMSGSVRGDQIALIAVHAIPHPYGVRPIEGSRLPFVAPVGAVYVAWSDPSDIETWLDRSVVPAWAGGPREALDDLEAIRRRGWSATIRVDGRDGGRELRDDDDGDLDVLGLSAPVFDRHHEVECSIAVVEPGRTLTRHEIEQIGEKVLAAARQVQT